MTAVAEAGPVPDVSIGAMTYEPPSHDDRGPIAGARGRFLVCYRKALAGWGFPTFEASFKITLSINDKGVAPSPTIGLDGGDDNRGSEAARECIGKELAKLRFGRASAHKVRFPIALVLHGKKQP